MSHTYSGSIDHERVLPALGVRLGWIGDATTPASGRYFDDGSFHALVTQANIKATQPNATLTSPQFDTLKADLKKAAILRALSLVFMEPDFIERGMVWIPERSPKQVISVGTEAFFGFEIQVATSDCYVIRINQATLDFTQASTFKLYLYAEGDAAPLWEQQVTATAGVQTLVDLVDCYFSYGLNRAVRYYFGYKPSELDGGALPQGMPVCMHAYTMALFTNMRSPVIPIDYAHASYPASSIGLNVECSIIRDHTRQLEQNPQIMDNLTGLVMAHMVLEGSVFSGRINASAGAVKENVTAFAAQFDLTGSIPASGAPTVESIRGRIKAEVARVKQIFQKKTKGVISDYDLY